MLYKCPDQTVAIDIWAVGVILLAVLCQKFPVFQSNDDVEALLELGALFGRIAMEKVAMLHSKYWEGVRSQIKESLMCVLGSADRTILTNVPSLDTAPRSLTEIVLKLNPKLYEPPCAYPTADDVEAHVVMVDDALDLLKKLLTLDATKRPTAHQALMHPFFNDNCLEHEMEKEDVVHPVAQGECKELHRVTEAGQRESRARTDTLSIVAADICASCCFQTLLQLTATNRLWDGAKAGLSEAIVSTEA